MRLHQFGWGLRACTLLLLAVAAVGCAGQPNEEGRIFLALPTASPTQVQAGVTPPAASRPTPQPARLVESLHPWSMVDGGVHRFRRSIVRGPHAQGEVLWTFDVGGTVLAEPVVAQDGTIYVVTREGVVKAVSPRGDLVWRYGASASILYAPALSESGLLYVASGKPGQTGAVVALDARTGEQKWRYLFSTGYGCLAPMILDSNGNILLTIGRQNMYQSPQPGYLLSLSPDGSERWRGLANVPFGSRAVVDGSGQLWVGGNLLGAEIPSSQLWLVNPEDGQPVESLRPGGFPYVSPEGEAYYWELHWERDSGQEGQIHLAEMTPHRLSVGPLGNLLTAELDEETVRTWGSGSPTARFAASVGDAVLQEAAWDGAGWVFGYLWDDLGSVLPFAPQTAELSEAPADLSMTVAAADGQGVVWSLELRVPITDESMRGDVSEPIPWPVTPLSVGEGRLYLCTFGGVLHAVGEAQ